MNKIVAYLSLTSFKLIKKEDLSRGTFKTSLDHSSSANSRVRRAEKQTQVILVYSERFLMKSKPACDLHSAGPVGK